MHKVDLEIHGILRLRLLNPSPANIALVKEQSGGLETTLNRNPDIILNFVDNIDLNGMNYVGLNFAGYRKNDFFILDENRFGGKVCIPFNEIGSNFQITVERKIQSFPVFNHILNLCFLYKGLIPLHASAFEYENQGIVVTGWTKGGKTEALLSFANHGAVYVGDEWLLLSTDGREVYGLPIPICIWEWQLPEIHRNKPQIGVSKILSFKSIHLISRFCEFLFSSRFGKSGTIKMLKKALPLLRKQLHVRSHPSKLYANKIKASTKLHKFFLMMSHHSDEIQVDTLEKESLIPRLVSSNIEEMEPFFQYYQAFKYAFPNNANPLIDDVESILTTRLEIALDEIPLFKVSHPYPVSFEELYQKMKPFCLRPIPETVINQVN